MDAHGCGGARGRRGKGRRGAAAARARGLLLLPALFLPALLLPALLLPALLLPALAAAQTGRPFPQAGPFPSAEPTARGGASPSAGPPPSSGPVPANVPVARAPALRPGDCWQFRNVRIKAGVRETVRCVVKALDGGYLMETYGRVKGLARYDRNLVWLGSIGLDRTIRQPARSEVPQRLAFPLYPGKNWTDAYRTLDPETGGFIPVANIYVVEAFEAVEVPAGRFQAFRVKRLRMNLTTGKIHSGLTWYAPAARNVIQVWNDWTGGTKMLLSAYRLQGAPAGAAGPGVLPAETMRASLILVPDAATAREVMRRLRAGEPFEKLAREFSTDPSKRFGGDIGTFRKGELLPEVEAVLRGLKVGEVGGPVKTRRGYHILRRTG